MKSFDKWFAEQSAPAEPAQLEPQLPEGIVEETPGVYVAQCRGCEEWSPIPCDLSEIPPEGYEHYCGGSPRCCP